MQVVLTQLGNNYVKRQRLISENDFLEKNNFLGN